MPAATTCCRARWAARRYPNNAWGAANNPAGDGRYVTDATCPSLNDPLTTKLAGGNSFANGTYSGLWFFAPPDTAITNYSMTVHHYWYAPGNGAPDETTYTALTLGPTLVGGTGQFDGTIQQNLANEGHWYGFRSPGSSGAADTGVLTRTLSDSTAAKTQRTATYMTVSAGCYNTAGCTLGPTANVFLELYGSRVTITDSTAPALSGRDRRHGAACAGNALGRRARDLLCDRQRRHPPRGARRRHGRRQPVGGRSRGLQRRRRRLRTRAAASRSRGPARTSRTRPLAASPAIAGKRTLLVRVTDAAGNETVSTPFAVTARGPVNGAGGGDGSRLVAGFPGHTFRGRGKARKKVGVLRPTKTVGWGHSAAGQGDPAQRRRPAGGGRRAAAARARAAPRLELRRSRRGDRPAPTAASRCASRAAPHAATASPIAPTRATPGSPRSPTSPSTPRRASPSTSRATSTRAGACASAAASPVARCPRGA